MLILEDLRHTDHATFDLESAKLFNW